MRIIKYFSRLTTPEGINSVNCFSPSHFLCCAFVSPSILTERQGSIKAKAAATLHRNKKMKLGTQNKAVMVLCVGPILFAMTVSAHRNNDYRYPTPAPASSADSSDSSDSSAATAPEAYTEYSYESPTEIYPGTPTPTTGDSPGPYTDATPGPVYDATPALTDDDVENTEEGAMPVIPSSTAGNGEEEENVAAPMNNAVDGASCSTYDEDVRRG